MIIKPEHLIQLLGLSIADPKIERLKKELGDCEIAEFDGNFDYCFYRHGFCLMFADNILGTIHLFSEGVDNYIEYPYPIPHGLRFSFTKAEVREALGKPTKSASANDVYRFPDHVLNVGYGTNPKTIRMLEFSTLESYDA